MKEKTGKALYNLLLALVGVCLIIGGVINIQKDGGYIAIIGCFSIGLGMILLAVKGLAGNIKA